MAALTRPLESHASEPPFVRAAAYARPGVAIVRREVGLMLGHRSFRMILFGLTAANLAIAYVHLADTLYHVNYGLAARQILLSQLSVLAGIGFFVTAARAATCISTERARDTWQLLWLVPASPLPVVVGYVVGSLAPALVLTVSQLPVIAPGIYAVGREWWPTIATGTAIAGVGWVAAAVWGVWASARYHRYVAALGTTLVTASIISGVAPAVLFGLVFGFVQWRSINSAVITVLLDALDTISPLLQIYRVVVEGKSITELGPLFLYLAAAIGVALLFATRALRNWSDPAVLVPRKFLSGGRHSATTGSTWEIPDGRNPIFALERRITAAGRTWKRPALFTGFALFVIWQMTILLSTGRWNSVEGTFVLIMFVAFGIAAWATAGGAAASKERNTLDMVSMTTLTDAAILRGKVAAGTKSVLPIFALIVFCTAIGARITGEYLIAAAVALSLAGCIATLLYSGLFACTIAPGTREALVSNVIIGLVMFYGLSIAVASAVSLFEFVVAENYLGLQRWITPYSDNWYRFQVAMVLTSPLIGMFELVDSDPDKWDWATWAGSLLTTVVWSLLWYCAALHALRRQRVGRPIWPGIR